MRWNLAACAAALSVCASISPADITVTTDRAAFDAFLSSIPNAAVESFESHPTDTALTMTSLSHADYTILTDHTMGVFSGFVEGHFSTHGEMHVAFSGVVLGPPDDSPVDTVRIDFTNPTSHFAMAVTDWGDHGEGDMALWTQADTSPLTSVAPTTIASVPPARANGDLFFVMVESDTPFSSVFINSATAGDGWGMDEMAFAKPIPAPATAALLPLGLGLAARRRRR